MPKDPAREDQTESPGPASLDSTDKATGEASAGAPDEASGSAPETGPGAAPGGAPGTSPEAASDRTSDTTDATSDMTSDAPSGAEPDPVPGNVPDEPIDEVLEDLGGETADKPEGALAVPKPRVAEPSVAEQPLAADPLTDMETRKREAGVNERLPFGLPGEPLGRTHPFVFGFTGALGVFAAWMLIQAITNARQVLILIVVSLFLAVGLNPAVEALQRRRVSRRWAVALVFLAVILAFAGFGFAIGQPLANEITAFVNHLPSYVQQLQQNAKIRDLDQRYQLLSKLQAKMTDANFGQQLVGQIVGVGKVVLGGLFNTLTVLILTLYFLGSLPTIKNFFYRMAPRSRRARVALLGDEILVRIGGYVAGTITVAFIAGTTAYLFLFVVEVPFALPLALIVGLTAFIPLVGATIGATLICLVAFLDGTGTGIACVVFFLIYQQVENYVIQPRIMRRAVDVHPAVTIIAALIGGTLLGIVGALLAIPTAAAIALIVREVIVPRQDTL